MVSWAVIFTSTVIATIVSAIVGPILILALRRRDEVKQRNFEIMYAEYKRYIERLESISIAAQETLASEFMPKTRDCFSRLYSSNEQVRAQALQEFNTFIFEFMTQMTASFSRGRSELQGLRIICSDSLLLIVDEFINRQQELMELALKQIKLISKQSPEERDGQHSPEVYAVQDEIKVKGKLAQDLVEKIVQQMRAELAVSK